MIARLKKVDWLMVCPIVAGIVSLFIIARPAYAITLADLFTHSLTDIITNALIGLMVGFINDVVSPLTQVLFDWSLDYTQIPYVNTLILWLQGLAIIAVIIVRVIVGIRDGILSQGSDEQVVSVGEYIYKSIIALIIVALMPMLCRTVIMFGSQMYTDILGGGTLADKLKWFTLGDSNELLDSTSDAALWALAGMLVITILCIACGYQFVRRQIEMLTVSIIGPLVSIYGATENDTNQVWNLLKNLFGLVCMQWLQYILVQIALSFGISWIEFAADNAFAGGAFAGEGAQLFMFTLGTFAAALTIPQLVDRYTFGASGSRAGSLAAGALISMGARSGVRAPGSAIGAASRIVRR